MSTDGGSAFPEIRTDLVGERGEYTTDTYSTGGMSLRDYFAAKAPIGMYEAMKADGMGDDLTYCLQSINCGNGGRLLDAHAKLAFQWADAMLKAREA